MVKDYVKTLLGGIAVYHAPKDISGIINLFTPSQEQTELPLSRRLIRALDVFVDHPLLVDLDNLLINREKISYHLTLISRISTLGTLPARGITPADWNENFLGLSRMLDDSRTTELDLCKYIIDFLHTHLNQDSLYHFKKAFLHFFDLNDPIYIFDFLNKLLQCPLSDGCRHILTATTDNQKHGATKVSFDMEKISEGFSRGQIESKKWLVQELANLNNDLGYVFICAGWTGLLALMIDHKKILYERIRSFDIDPSCEQSAEIFNSSLVRKAWRFKAQTYDIHDLEYDEFIYHTRKGNGDKIELCETASTIINTSCEHIPNFDQWLSKIPKDKLVVLQSNNFFESPEHINCVSSIDEFRDLVGLSEILFQGELKLEDYTRYMIIGYS